MKKLIKTMGVLCMALMTTACSAEEKQGYYKGYELPPYTVRERSDNIELRDYQPQLVAEVTVEGDRDDAVGAGFRILASYIFGDNVAKKEVTMTAPVTQNPAGEKIAMTTPVAQWPEGEQWVVQFGMPKEYTLDTLPKATDERIRFRNTNVKTVAAIQFSGRWTDGRFAENKAALEQFITARALKPLAPPSFAYYDDPFTLPWNRRNEILIEVQP
jgi:SOUL heme-binding protein